MITKNLPPEAFIGFVLKLSSESSGLERQAAVESIATQLREFEQSPFFTDALEELRPDNFTSTTKTLPDYQREVLAEAIRNYCGD